jgi:membrane dipeptidase
MKFPVFDLHCDTALALLGEDLTEVGSLRKNQYHIDLERAKVLPGYVQCFACFTTPFMSEWHKKDPTMIFEKEIETVMREMYYNSDLISQIHTIADIDKNRKGGKMSAILTIEGTAGFGFNPAMLENLHQIGFRITTLGWNEQNPLCGSHKTGGGLTDLGREYVKEAQRLGMIIDVSHISDEAFWDIMDITEAPIIASHSNSRSVCPVSRNLTDDMFRAICQSGGVAGFNMCAPFVGVDPDLDTVADHFIHFLELGGEKHIALGGDLDGCDVLPKGFDGVQDYPKLADKLLERGLGDALVYDIFWNNAMEVMRKCCT